MDATDLHLMTGSYVLGALDEPDRRAFEAHLAECTACTQEVRELEATAALLGSAEAVAPPARLRARVLAETRAMPQRGGVEPAAADAAVEAATPSPLRRRLTAVTAVAAVLLVVVSLVLGAWALSLRRTEQRLSAEASRIGTVLTAPDAATTSGSLTSGGQGAIVVSRADGAGVFIGTGLARPAAGRTYQLWYLDAAGSARSAGLFRPQGDGSAVVRLDGAPGSSTTVALTLEPRGGSPAPTSMPVLTLPLPRV